MLRSVLSPLRLVESSLRLVGESRAALEWAGYAAGLGGLDKVPHGDGHPVVVVAGVLDQRLTCAPMLKLLDAKGYAAYSWEPAAHLGAVPRMIAGLEARIERLHQLHGTGVSLIGLSLGGLLAREAARRRPELVRNVVTLSTPIGRPPAGNGGPPSATLLSSLIEELHERVGRPLPVPATSIFSRTGLFDWRRYLQAETPLAENVEVFSSQLGMSHNPLALGIVLDRLAQPEGGWRRYRRALRPG